MKRLPTVLAAILFVGVAPAAQPPAEPGKTPAPKPNAAPTKVAGFSGMDADLAAIQANDEAFIKAFDAGDAEAISATFTEDAEMIDEDHSRAEGRAAIAEKFANYFATLPGAKIKLETESIKLLGPDTAVVRGRSDVTLPDETHPETSRFTVIFVKRAGKWLQASCRDERDDQTTSQDRLKTLEWLVGDWVSESDESVIHWSCKWSDNKNFLLLAFDIQMHGKPAMSGTQRIGWDPLTRQFMSWVFDSEGGYGVGHWSSSGDGWVVKAHGVRRDGRPASATQVITRQGQDIVQWTSIDRTVGGKVAPNHDQFIMARKPPKPR